jgi:predicted aldo/keto reductase-like oxidoreductase
MILGKTGIISQFSGFGALPIQRISADSAIKLLRRARENGFTYFDTARAYTDSEAKIAAALGDVRDKIIIATKTTAKSAGEFWRDLHTSLETLKTDYIDVYQFHNPPFCPKPGGEDGLYNAVVEAKRQGKVLHIGITNHRLHIATEAAQSGLYETLQYPFSYLSSEPEIELVKLCNRENVGFVCMKALAGGLITSAAAAYAWLSQFDVLPIWGIQHNSELSEFVELGKLTDRQTDKVQKIIESDRAELADGFCRGCGYCMPGCPAEINIGMAARMSLFLRRSPFETLLTEWGQALMRKVNACTDCGQCEEKCPYGLPTRELLKRNLTDYEQVLLKGGV